MAKFDIYIDGSRLDIPTDTELSLTWQDLRFCNNSFPDGVSVDIELPLTRNNRNILGILGPLYNGLPLVKRGIITCKAFQRECRVSVQSVTADNMTAAVYVSSIPSGMVDKQLFRLTADNSSTIWGWYEITQTYDNSFFPDYRAEEGGATGLYARHAFATWGTEIKPAIEAECSCTIDDTAAITNYPDFLDVGVLADGKRLCPENPVQCVQVVCYNGQTNGLICGGQHVVNDLDSHDDFSWYVDQLQLFPSSWLWKNSAIRTAGEREMVGTDTMTFDRDCTASVIIRCIGDQTGTFELMHNSTSHTPTFTFESGTYYKATLLLTISAGDKITFPNSSADGETYMLQFTYSNYTVEDADYEKELYYMPIVQGFSIGTDPNEPSWSGWSFSYFGLWCNMPKRSVRSYLTTLSWLSGCSMKITGNTLTYSTMGTVKTDVSQLMIDSIENSDETLGRTNSIQWRDTDTFKTQWKNTGNGEDETVVFESEFMQPRATRIKPSGFGFDFTLHMIPQYIMQYAGTGYQNDWPVRYTDLEGVIGLLVFDPDTLLFGIHTVGALNALGLDTLTTAVTEVEGRTFDNITGADILNAEGVALIPKEIVYSSTNGVFTYKALKGGTFIQVTPPQPVNERSFIGLYVNGEYRVIGKIDNTDFNIIGK